MFWSKPDEIINKWFKNARNPTVLPVHPFDKAMRNMINQVIKAATDASNKIAAVGFEAVSNGRIGKTLILTIQALIILSGVAFTSRFGLLKPLIDTYKYLVSSKSDTIQIPPNLRTELKAALKQPGRSEAEANVIHLVEGLVNNQIPSQIPSLSAEYLRSLCKHKGIPTSGSRHVLVKILIREIEMNVEAAVTTITPLAPGKAPRASKAHPVRTNAWVEFCKTTRAEVRAQGHTVSMADLSRMWTEHRRRATVLHRGRT